MKFGNSEAVSALRQSAERLRIEAAALDETADLLERVQSDLAESGGGDSPPLQDRKADTGAMETLGRVWTSEAAEVYTTTIEERERKLHESTYDVGVVRGCSGVADALDELRARYGDTLDIQDVAVALLDAGVCRSNAGTRKLRVGRAKTKVYEYVKKSADWERVRENTMQFVGAKVAPASEDAPGEKATSVGT